MCLYTTNTKIRTAKKDIICYKILIKERKKWISRKSTYRAPFFINYTYRLKERYYLGKSLIHGFTEEYPYTVHKGFHSFVDIQDAKRMLSEWCELQGGKITIVQCIIPKGAEYIKGTIAPSENSPASYVSDEIICVKEI
jgi:hypothetical protein